MVMADCPLFFSETLRKSRDTILTSSSSLRGDRSMKPAPFTILAATLFAFATTACWAQQDKAKKVVSPGAYLKKPEAWFTTGEAKRIAGNILSYQSDLGGWPKNT